jgi:hypothetical protein
MLMEESMFSSMFPMRSARTARPLAMRSCQRRRVPRVTPCAGMQVAQYLQDGMMCHAASTAVADFILSEPDWTAPHAAATMRHLLHAPAHCAEVFRPSTLPARALPLLPPQLLRFALAARAELVDGVLCLELDDFAAPDAAAQLTAATALAGPELAGL